MRALVTGCSRGIGRAVAEMLLAEGWYVDGISRTRPDLEHARFMWTACDVGKPRAVARVSGWLGGPITALIHCAGIRGPSGPLAANDPARWLDTIATNLTGTYLVTKMALDHLKPPGRILLMSGGGAFDPSPEFSAYAVAKAGVVSLMETLAAELEGTGITVNCVAPGYVPTTIHAAPVDDGGKALRRAVACIRALLGPSAFGLTGKTISAAHDDWESLQAYLVPALNASRMGTRARNPLQRVRELSRPTTGLLAI